MIPTIWQNCSIPLGQACWTTMQTHKKDNPPPNRAGEVRLVPRYVWRAIDSQPFKPRITSPVRVWVGGCEALFFGLKHMCPHVAPRGCHVKSFFLQFSSLLPATCCPIIDKLMFSNCALFTSAISSGLVSGSFIWKRVFYGCVFRYWFFPCSKLGTILTHAAVTSQTATTLWLTVVVDSTTSLRVKSEERKKKNLRSHQRQSAEIFILILWSFIELKFTDKKLRFWCDVVIDRRRALCQALKF